jgi:hypothetical protein
LKSDAQRKADAEAEWKEFNRPLEESSDPRFKNAWRTLSAVPPEHLEIYRTIGSFGLFAMPQEVFYERCAEMGIRDREKRRLAYVWVRNKRHVYRTHEKHLSADVRQRINVLKVDEWPTRSYKRKYRYAYDIALTTGVDHGSAPRDEEDQEVAIWLQGVNREAPHGEPSWFIREMDQDFDDPSRKWIYPKGQSSTQ